MGSILMKRVSHDGRAAQQFDIAEQFDRFLFEDASDPEWSRNSFRPPMIILQ